MFDTVKRTLSDAYHSKYNPDISLEKIVGSARVAEFRAKRKYEENVDRFSSISYSIIAGVYVDSLVPLTPIECLISRGSSIPLNYFTGDYYGKWRDKVFARIKTTDKMSKPRQVVTNIITDIIAFNTFQVPVYAAALALTQVPHLFTHQEFDTRAIIRGMGYLALYSPFSAPTFGYFMNIHREFFGIPTPREKAKLAITNSETVIAEDA
jgi:hypothetical protein